MMIDSALLSSSREKHVPWMRPDDDASTWVYISTSASLQNVTRLLLPCARKLKSPALADACTVVLVVHVPSQRSWELCICLKRYHRSTITN